MAFHWPKKLPMIAGLPLLLASASCVPGPRLAGHAIPTVNQTAPPEAPKLFQSAGSKAVRAHITSRAAQLLAPVSAQPAAPFNAEVLSADDRARSLNCLASAIYYEARSEPEAGQRAVAQVVLNRVRHPAFPSTVCGVVFQGSQRRTGCQFSFTCDGSLARRPLRHAWEKAQRIATELFAGAVYAPVGNATHYHTRAVRPYWAPSLHKSAVVGAHIFYRWRGSAGEAAAFRQRHGGLEPSPAFWNKTPGKTAGVTTHVGIPPVLREQVSVDGSASLVNIHRGAVNSARVAVNIHKGPAAAPAAEASSEGFGVRVHTGAKPADS